MTGHPVKWQAPQPLWGRFDTTAFGATPAASAHAARADEASRELGGTANAGATKSPAPSPSLPRPRIRTRRPIALAVSIALSRAARKTADDLCLPLVVEPDFEKLVPDL